MYRSPFALFVLVLILGGLSGFGGLSGCRSFDETVKPLIDQKAPDGYKPPVYMTGTATLAEVNPAGLQAEVWRVNSTPYPDSVQLFVRVFNAEGKLVTNLAPPYYSGTGDYRAIWSGLTEAIGDDGPQGKIDAFSVREFSDQDGIPYELSLVLDYSGTMGSNMKGLEDAAIGFIKLKRPQDRISVIKFDKEPRVAVAATSSDADLYGTFVGKGLDGYGSYTAIYTAAKAGGEQVAASPSDHPRALVLFTDGMDNASTVTSSQLYDYCRTQNIPVFTVAFGDVNRSVLTDISNYTGGRFYQAYTSEELRSTFADIYRSLRNYYVVTYRPPFVPGKHIARLNLNIPGAPKSILATAIYNTLQGRVIDDKPIEFRDTVFFEYNKSVVKPEALPSLQAIAELMRENQRLKIEVRGHTDATGTEEHNKKLSEDRAAAVRQALVALGIPESRLRSRGFGFEFPVASNDTEEGRQKNRRVAFVIIAR